MEDSYAAILVVDLGLTNCKAVVFSAEGEILGRAAAPYVSYRPSPGYVEQDPEEWWAAVRSVVCELWEAHPKLASQIACISVTGHMHALVCLDGNGQPLARALVLGDQRSIDVAAAITADLGLPTIYEITGARMDASMPMAKIRWLKENAPQVYKDTKLFTGCKDYIRHRLTGDRLTEPIDACAMSLFDIQARRWSEDLIRLAGISQGKLPEVRDPTTLAGTIQSETAHALGLQAGIPVVLGGGDDIEVLGNGLIGTGSSLEHLGTTGSILTTADKPIYDPDMALELYPHADPGLWVLGGSITAGGSVLAWAAESLGYGKTDEAQHVLLQSSSDSHSPLVFIPHLMGERSPSWEPHVRGAWIGLSPTHTNHDMMRAAFEGVAFALKSMLENIESLVGKQNQIIAAQMPPDNPRWLRMRTDIYGRPLSLLRTPEPTALGAMALAAVGIGLYPDLREVVEVVTGLEKTICPDMQASEAYQKRFAVYQQAGAALLPVWRSLHELNPSKLKEQESSWASRRGA